MDIGDVTVKLRTDLGNSVSQAASFKSGLDGIEKSAGELGSSISNLGKSLGLLETESGNAATSVQTLRTNLSDSVSSTSDAGRAASDAAKGLQELSSSGDSVGNLSQPLRLFDEALGDSTESAGALTGALSDTVEEIGGISQKASDAAGEAALFEEKLQALIDSGMSSAEAIGALGINIDDIYAKTIAAGGSFEDFVEAVGNAALEAQGAGTDIGKMGEAFDSAGGFAGGAAEQLDLFNEAAQIPYEDAAGQLNMFTTELEPISGAANEAAEALVGFSEGAQQIVDSQRDAEAALSASQAVLLELQTAFDNGAASAGAVAQAAADVQKNFDALNPTIGASKGSFDDLAGTLTAVAAGFAFTAGLKAFAMSAIEAADAVDDATTALGALGGGAETAKATVEELRQIAKDDALSFPAILQASQRMTTFLESSEQVPEIIRSVADSAAVMGTSVEGASRMFERLVSGGELNKRSLLQLGITIEDVGKALGVTGIQAADAFKQLDQSKKIDVLREAMSKFDGLAAKMSADTLGNLTRLGQDFTEVLENIGYAIDPIISKMVDWIRVEIVPFAKSLVDAFRDMPEPIQAATVALGGVGLAIPAVALGIAGISGVVGQLGKVLPAANAGLALFGTNLGTLGLAAKTASPYILAIAAVIGAFEFSGAREEVQDLAKTIYDNLPTWDQFTRTIKTLSETELPGLSRALESNSWKGFTDAVKNLAEMYLPGLNKLVQEIGKNAEDAHTKFDKWHFLAPGIAAFRDSVKGVNDNIEFLTGNYKNMADAGIANATRVASELASAALIAAGGYDKLKGAQSNVNQATKDIIQSQDEANKKLADAKKAYEDLERSLRTNTPLLNGHQATQAEVNRALGEFRSAQENANVKLKEAEDKFNAISPVIFDTAERYNWLREMEDGAAIATAKANAAFIEGKVGMDAYFKAIEPIPEAVGKAADATYRIAEAAIKAGAIGPVLDPLQQAYKNLGIAIDGAGTAASNVLKDFEAIATSPYAKLPGVQAAWEKVRGEVEKLAKTDLPAAIRMQEGYRDALTRLNAPLADVMRAEAALLDLRIRQAEGNSTLTDEYKRQLEDLKQKAKELGIELENVGKPAKKVKSEWEDAWENIQRSGERAWQGIAAGLSDLLVDGGKFGETMVGVFKNIAKSILDDLINAALRTLKNVLVDLISGDFSFTSLAKSIRDAVKGIGDLASAISGGGSGGGKGIFGGLFGGGSILGNLFGGSGGAAHPSGTDLMYSPWGGMGGGGGSGAAGAAGAGMSSALGIAQIAMEAVGALLTGITGFRMEGTMNAVEANTRITAILTGQAIAEILWPIKENTDYSLGHLEDINAHSNTIIALLEQIRDHGGGGGGDSAVDRTTDAVKAAHAGIKDATFEVKDAVHDAKLAIDRTNSALFTISPEIAASVVEFAGIHEQIRLVEGGVRGIVDTSSANIEEMRRVAPSITDHLTTLHERESEDARSIGRGLAVQTQRNAAAADAARQAWADEVSRITAGQASIHDSLTNVRDRTSEVRDYARDSLASIRRIPPDINDPASDRARSALLHQSDLHRQVSGDGQHVRYGLSLVQGSVDNSTFALTGILKSSVDLLVGALRDQTRSLREVLGGAQSAMERIAMRSAPLPTTVPGRRWEGGEPGPIATGPAPPPPSMPEAVTVTQTIIDSLVEQERRLVSELAALRASGSQNSAEFRDMNTQLASVRQQLLEQRTGLVDRLNRLYLAQMEIANREQTGSAAHTAAVTAALGTANAKLQALRDLQQQVTDQWIAAQLAGNTTLATSLVAQLDSVAQQIKTTETSITNAQKIVDAVTKLEESENTTSITNAQKIVDAVTKLEESENTNAATISGVVASGVASAGKAAADAVAAGLASLGDFVANFTPPSGGATGGSAIGKYGNSTVAQSLEGFWGPGGTPEMMENTGYNKALAAAKASGVSQAWYADASGNRVYVVNPDGTIVGISDYANPFTMGKMPTSHTSEHLASAGPGAKWASQAFKAPTMEAWLKMLENLNLAQIQANYQASVGAMTAFAENAFNAIPSFDNGGTVLRDMLAFVHRGEKILTPTEVRAGEGLGRVVNIGPFIINGANKPSRELLREIAETVKEAIHSR